MYLKVFSSFQQHFCLCCRVKDADIQENLMALSEISKAVKQMLEVLKVETVETLERLKKESEVFARKIADAG